LERQSRRRRGNTISTILSTALLASVSTAQAPAPPVPGGIDTEAYWRPAQHELAQFGDGFLVWESRRSGDWRIWTIRLDGTGLRQLSPEEPDRQHYCPHIAPDGKRLVYLSLPDEAPGADTGGDPPWDRRGDLHLIDRDGKNNRVIATGARKYNGWDRAVTWFTPNELAYIGPDRNTYQLNLETGTKELLIQGGKSWLPNTKKTHAVWSVNTFSLFDPKTKTVTPMPYLGGCQPYFTRDGVWGFWMRSPGIPVYKMHLGTRAIGPIMDRSLLPPQRDYVYFPMISANQRLLAFGAANAANAAGQGFELSDFDIFVVPIDPQTLDVVGKPVRYTFDPSCDRFPDVYQEDPALGFHANKAPFTVAFPLPGPVSVAEWNYGDGTVAKAEAGKHTYTQPGVFVLEAKRDGKVFRGQVRVTPAKAPKVTGVVLENEREVVVTFDEPVDLKKLALNLESKAAIAKWVAEDDRSLRVTLAAKPVRKDRLVVAGVADRAQRPNPMDTVALDVEPQTWPANPKGLVFVWENGKKTNLVRDPVTNQMTAYSAKAQEGAVFDRHYAMVTDEGAFVFPDFVEQFGNAVRKSNGLSIELTLTPHGPATERPGCVLSFGLTQVRGRLVFQLNDTNTELCSLPVNQASHVVITYEPDHLVCYVNGQQVLATDKVKGDLKGYLTGALPTNPKRFEQGPDKAGERLPQMRPLSVGNDQEHHPWGGTVEGIAMYDRALSPQEVLSNATAYRDLRAARKPVERLELRGKLVASSITPVLKKIQPYRQALMVNEYQVEKVLRGTYTEKKIRVAHWAMLDEQTRRITQLPLGTRLDLLVEPMLAQPQLEGQFLSNTLDEDFDLAIYYAVRHHWKPPLIRSWHVIGGFPSRNDKDSLDKPFDIEGKSNLPDSYAPEKGPKWKTLPCDANGYVDLLELPTKGIGCAYAVVHVTSPTARKLVLSAGTIGGLKVWVNGKEVMAGRLGRLPYLGYKQAEVELKEGSNEVLVKCTQEKTFWGFSCDLLTADGKAIPELTYAP
jgi:hypothetical protein